MSSSAAAQRPRPLVLCTIGGLGERSDARANALRLARTPHLTALAAGPRSLLEAGGADVGLPEGQAGDGHLGHLALGAGRIPVPVRARVDAAIADRSLRMNPVVDHSIFLAKHHHGARLHLFSLLSDGPNGSLALLEALVEAASRDEIEVVVHGFLDGRDAPPKSAGAHVGRIERLLDGGKKGVIGTLAGRSWAMDHDGRWDRVHLAYKAIVRGEAPSVETTTEAIARAYQQGRGDGEIEPVRVGDYRGIKGSLVCDFNAKDRSWRWFGEENGLALDLRPDGMAQLSAMLTRKDLPSEAEALLTDRGKPIFAFDRFSYATLTEPDPALGVPAAFPREILADTFGEIVAGAGLAQLRCAETERRLHVTTSFSGGREAPFAREERSLTPSRRDAAWAKHPEMSAAAVAEGAALAIRGGEHAFILVHFANPDVVAHTGDLDAAQKAVEAVDAAVGHLVDAVREVGGALLVTADHGNCEHLRDANGAALPGHTTSPVPLYYLNEAEPASPAARLRPSGRLADVAPTLLDLLGLPRPDAMTGRSLLER